MRQEGYRYRLEGVYKLKNASFIPISVEKALELFTQSYG